MDNNNNIPYGSISWDNEDSFGPTNQRRETIRNPSLRPQNATANNGLRFSLRGSHFPPPQQRVHGVGISRNSELANRLPRGDTTQSNFQQSSNSNSPPFERYFSLRPSQNTSHIQMHTPLQESQTSNNQNISTSFQGQAFPSLYSNPTPGSSSGNPAITSMLLQGHHSRNNNVEMSRGLNGRGRNESFHAYKAKRKSSLSEGDDGQEGPSSKRYLSERMAARMHNLRISNDHNNPVNILQSLMANQAVGTSDSQICEGNDNNSDDDKVKNTDAMQNRQDNLPRFVLSTHVKEAITKQESIIPEAIYNQISKPCLAVVPWKSPDDGFSLSTDSKEVCQENNVDLPNSNSSSTCSSLIMESLPETNQLQDKGVHHVEIVGECSTFSFEDDDDMDP